MIRSRFTYSPLPLLGPGSGFPARCPRPHCFLRESSTPCSRLFRASCLPDLLAGRVPAAGLLRLASPSSKPATAEGSSLKLGALAVPPTCTPTPCSDALPSEEHTSELQSHVNLVCRL